MPSRRPRYVELMLKLGPSSEVPPDPIATAFTRVFCTDSPSTPALLPVLSLSLQNPPVHQVTIVGPNAGFLKRSLTISVNTRIVYFLWTPAQPNKP